MQKRIEIKPTEEEKMEGERQRRYDLQSTVSLPERTIYFQVIVYSTIRM